MAHNTASRGYRGGELDDDSTPVSRPLNMAHNTLPQVFARMGLLPQVLMSPGSRAARSWGRVAALIRGSRPLASGLRSPQARSPGLALVKPPAGIKESRDSLVT